MSGIKYTPNTLKKLEGFIAEMGYEIRYEKGQFQSGYCLLKDKRMIVINKFYDTEGRIQSLIDILQQLDLTPDAMPDYLAATFRKALLE